MGAAIYTSPDGVDKVLEVNAGVVAKDNIKVGDTVTESGGMGIIGFMKNIFQRVRAWR